MKKNMNLLVSTWDLWFRKANQYWSFQDSKDVKVLGIWWEINKDVLWYQLHIERIRENIFSTKRQVLGILKMIFDPLVLLGYLILKEKLVFKKCLEMKHRLGWEYIWREISKVDLLYEGSAKNSTHSNPNVVYRFSTYFAGISELHVIVDADEEATFFVTYVVRELYGHRETALIDWYERNFKYTDVT